MMNSRERVNLALQHKEADRVPLDLGRDHCDWDACQHSLQASPGVRARSARHSGESHRAVSDVR